MVTVFDEKPGGTTVVSRDSSSVSGWVVAVLILLAVVGGLIYAWKKYRGAPAPAPTGGSANINLTLPTGSGENGGVAE